MTTETGNHSLATGPDAVAGITIAELAAALAMTWVAAVIVLSFLLSKVAGTIAPLPVLLASVAATAATAAWLRRRMAPEGGDIAAAASVFAAVLVWLLWRAWPELLPLGGEPDLTHHLQLVGYIERHWRLASDVAALTQIGNMANYTPGVHLLAALAGAWTGTDGLHAMHPIVAFSVALKSAIVFLVVRRILPPDTRGRPIAICAVLLLFLPYDYFVGSFAHFSFLAQVASETFAVAMWWALVRWDERPSSEADTLFAIAGMGAFLTWPIWIGPPLLVLLIVALARRDLPVRVRLQHLALAVGPIAAIAALHTIGRIQAAEIVTTGGAVFRPSAARLGWVFIVLVTGGLWLALRDRAYRVTLLVLGAIGLQALALYAVAKAGGADTPYLAIKMIHLALYPMAACGALALTAVWRSLTRGISPPGGFAPPAPPTRSLAGAPAAPLRSRGSLAALARTTRVMRRLGSGKRHGRAPRWPAWVLMAVLAADVTYRLSSIRSRPPAITEDLFLAGTWARTHVNPGCVEYLVPQDSTSYWLHLVVLWNPSFRPPGASPPILVFREAVARWITGTAYPVAIADLAAIPRDVREELDALARFGSIVVARRRGAAMCPQS